MDNLDLENLDDEALVELLNIVEGMDDELASEEKDWGSDNNE